MRIYKLLCLLSTWALSSGCLYSTYGLLQDKAARGTPMVVVSAHTTPQGDLVVALDHVRSAFRLRSGMLVLHAAELDAAFAGAPVESLYRLSLPHVVLARERLLERASPAPLEPIPALHWDSDGRRNAPPEPSQAPLVLHWTRAYRTGREKTQTAFLASRRDPSGTRQAVFVVDNYAPRGWDFGVRIGLLCADVVLIALLVA